MALHNKKALSALAVLMTASLALSAAPANAAPTKGKVTRAAGYAIKATGKTTGGWVGVQTLTIGDKKYGSVYMDPKKSPAREYNADTIQFTSDIDGAYRGPSARATSRAAYVLGKWSVGKVTKTEGAAVDLAVNSILYSGSVYGYQGKVGKSRAKQTKNAAKINKLVKKYLAESNRMAGPYDIDLRARGTSGNIQINYSIKTLSNKPVANKNVVFQVNGGEPTTLKTDKSGKVNLVLGQQTPGESQVRATVQGVYDWKLPIASALSKKGSRLAIAPAKTNVTKTTVGKTTGDQVVSIKTANPTALGTNIKGTATVNGWDGDRTLTSNLYGPFSTVDAANTNACTGSPKATSSQTINADGAYNLVETTSELGYYRYGVNITGNSANNSYAGCSTPFAVKSQAKISVARDTAKVTRTKETLAKVTVSGLPEGTTNHTVTVNLYGSFNKSEGVNCGSANLFKKVTLNVNKNGTFNTSKLKMNQAGHFGWSASMAGSEFVIGASSTCAPPNSAKFEVIN